RRVLFRSLRSAGAARLRGPFHRLLRGRRQLGPDAPCHLRRDARQHRPAHSASRRQMMSFPLRRLFFFAPLAALAACQTVPPPVPLSSLRQSGEVSFLCLDSFGRGAPLSRCPQGPLGRVSGISTASDGHELFALVTQTISGEVAVVRVTGVDSAGYSTAHVIDVDPTNPGVNHLRVREQPRGLATTPGGLASFVGVAETGKEGIFALPTSCILEPGQRADGTPETVRDLTTWPACSLPSA